jgi:hypothetical protein
MPPVKKKNKISMPIDRPTTQDSLDLYNNSKKVIDFYEKNKKDYSSTNLPNNKIKTFEDIDYANNLFENVRRNAKDNISYSTAIANYYTKYPPKNYKPPAKFVPFSIKSTYKPSTALPKPVKNTNQNKPKSNPMPDYSKIEYRKNIDANKFYQRENANGTLNLNAPMQLFDRRINPQLTKTFANNNPTSPYFGDHADISIYDPIAIKPVSMLTPKERKEREKKYGTINKSKKVAEEKETDEQIIPQKKEKLQLELVEQPQEKPKVEVEPKVNPEVEPKVTPQETTQQQVQENKKLPGGTGSFARYPKKQGFFSKIKDSFNGLMQNRMVNGRDVNNISVTGPTFISGAKSVKQYRGDENLPEAKNGMKKNCGCKHTRSKYKYQDGSNNLTSNETIPVNDRKKNIMNILREKSLLNKYGYSENDSYEDEEKSKEKNNTSQKNVVVENKPSVKAPKEYKKKSGIHYTPSKFFRYAKGNKNVYIPFEKMNPTQQEEYRKGMQGDTDFNVTNIGKYAKPTKEQKEVSAKFEAKYKEALLNAAAKRPNTFYQTPISKSKVSTPNVPVTAKPQKDSWTEKQWQDLLKQRKNATANLPKPVPQIPTAKPKPAPALPAAKFLDPNSKGVLMSQQGKPLPAPKPLKNLKDAIYNFPKVAKSKRRVAPVENKEIEEPSMIDSARQAIDSAKEAIQGLISGGQRLIQKTQKENPESINNERIVDEDTIVTPPKSNVKVDSLPVNYGYKEFKTYPDPYSSNPTDSLVSFRNVFDNDSGAEYVIGHKVNEVTKAGARKKFNNVRGVAHFLRDSDILPGQKITPKKWTTTKGDEYETTSPGKTVSAPDLQYMDRYRMVYKPIPGTDKYKTKYIKPGSQEALRQLEKEGWETDFTVSGQHKFSDIDWDKEGKKTGYKGIFDETRWVPLKNGEFTHIPYKDKGSFSRFSGGSVTYLFKHPVTGKSIGADFSGSVNDMRDYGNKLIQKYKLNPQDLEVVYHDMGSYSAKPKAKNGTLDYDQWEGYNSYNKGFSGAPLIVPNYKHGTAALTIPEGSAIVTANGGKNKQALRAYKKGNYKLLNKIIDGMPEDKVHKKQGGDKDLKAKYQYLAGLTGPLSQEQSTELENIKGELTKPSYDLYDDKRIAEKFGQKYDVDRAKWRSSLKGGKLSLKENQDNINHRNRLRNDPAFFQEEMKAGRVTVDKNGNVAYKPVGTNTKNNMEFLGTSTPGKLPDLLPPGPPTIPGTPPPTTPPPGTPPKKKGFDFPSLAEVAARTSILGQGVENVPENYLKLDRYNYASQLPKTLQENSLAAQSAMQTSRDIVGGDAGRYLAQAGNITSARMKANNEAVIEDTLARQDILNKNVDLSNVELTTNRGLKDQYAAQRSANRGAYNNQLIATGQGIDTAVDTSKLMASQRNVDDIRTNLLKSGNYYMDKEGNVHMNKTKKGAKKLKTYKRK